MPSIIDLPLEIRHMVYRYALVSESPVVVYSGNLSVRGIVRDSPDDEDLLDLAMIIRDHDSTTRSINELGIGLLRTNGMLSQETRPIFYGHNVFAFNDYHEWTSICSWLRGIGIDNQRRVRRIQVQLRKPSPAWQKVDGSRVPLDDDFPLPVYARSVAFADPVEGCEEGTVDIIDPEIEEVLKLVGSPVDGPSVDLQLHLPSGTMPGMLPYEPQLFSDYHSWFSMDMVNLVEYWRLIWTCGQSERMVSVTWIAMGTRQAMGQAMEHLAGMGWHLLCDVGEDSGNYNFSKGLRMARKSLMSRLVADHPNPWYPE